MKNETNDRFLKNFGKVVRSQLNCMTKMMDGDFAMSEHYDYITIGKIAKEQGFEAFLQAHYQALGQNPEVPAIVEQARFIQIPMAEDFRRVLLFGIKDTAHHCFVVLKQFVGLLFFVPNITGTERGFIYDRLAFRASAYGSMLSFFDTISTFIPYINRKWATLDREYFEALSKGKRLFFAGLRYSLIKPQLRLALWANAKHDEAFYKAKQATSDLSHFAKSY